MTHGRRRPSETRCDLLNPEHPDWAALNIELEGQVPAGSGGQVKEPKVDPRPGDCSPGSAEQSSAAHFRLCRLITNSSRKRDMVVHYFAQRELSGRKHAIIAPPRPPPSSLAHVPSHASAAERHNDARRELPGRGKVHHNCAFALRGALRMDVAARLRGHIGNDEDAPIDYGQRHRAAKPIPSARTEGAVIHLAMRV